MPLDSKNDHPLAHIQIGAMNKNNGRPIPLLATDIDVQIRSGIAIVKTERIFANKENVSIEATLTFPIPVHATMMSLEAKIDERTLKGVAKRKVVARETYETALDSGKTAILHEEILRGLHMLSVGHVPPGKEVKVICTWTMPLVRANLSGDAMLRIPTTIGDIYGTPPMLDSVAPTHDSYIHKAHLKVSATEASVTLVDGNLVNSEAEVTLDSPIDIKVVGVTWGVAMEAVSRSGKTITLRVAPGRGSDENIDSVVLVDRSSSMSSMVSRNHEGTSIDKHQVFVHGLSRASNQIQKDDVISLWEFDSNCQFIGKAKGAKAVKDLIPLLGSPRNSTELGSALQKILGKDECRDILIATDGKTYSLDVQKLAQSGRRFHVILIGDDSLDANVGSLAAMTGGELFPVSGQNSDDAILLAMEALRRPNLKPAKYVKGMPKSVESFIGGMVVNAEWNDKAVVTVEDDFSKAVVAIATSMALAGMDNEKASDLAEQEGIVCHLTSLVLIDEEAEAQLGIPEQRKVHLSTPNTMWASSGADMSFEVADVCIGKGYLDKTQTSSPALPRMPIIDMSGNNMFTPPILDTGIGKLTTYIGTLSWNFNTNAWLSGDLSTVPTLLRLALINIATSTDILSIAQMLKKPAVVVALAILAQLDAPKNIGAQRFARNVLNKADAKQVEALVKRLG